MIASHPENDGITNGNETEPNIKLPTSRHNSSEDIGSISTRNAENGTSNFAQYISFFFLLEISKTF